MFCFENSSWFTIDFYKLFLSKLLNRADGSVWAERNQAPNFWKNGNLFFL